MYKCIYRSIYLMVSIDLNIHKCILGYNIGLYIHKKNKSMPLSLNTS